MPKTKIIKKSYPRSKFDHFNKLAASFILNQFQHNLDEHKHKLSWLRSNTEPSQFHPLTNWVLSLPKTQDRSQQIVRLAFIHNYKYNSREGTIIPLLKQGNKEFDAYKELQKNSQIGINSINKQRAFHRQALKLTTLRTMKCFLAGKNERGVKLDKFTKKQILRQQIDEYLLKLKKFFDQLVQQPIHRQTIIEEVDSKSQYSQELEEYNSQVIEHFDNIANYQVCCANQRSQQSLPYLSHANLTHQNQANSIDQNSHSRQMPQQQLIPIPDCDETIQSLSIFDDINSQESMQHQYEQICRNDQNIKKNQSSDQDNWSVCGIKKMNSMCIYRSDNDYEQYQRQKANKIRINDYLCQSFL